MSVRSGQSVTTTFPVSASNGAAVNADSLPTGTLIVNGSANGATVTVTNITTGQYEAQVTLPTLAIGDIVSIWIAATVSSVAGANKIWEDTKDVNLDSSGDVTFNNTTIGTATNLTNAPTSGDFTSTMKASIGTAVAASAVASVTGNVGGNVTGSVGSVSGNVGGNVSGNVTGNVGGSVVGDVEGKVLGGGSSSITGIGAEVDVRDIDGHAVSASGSVTVGAFVGQGTAALAVDASGNAAVQSRLKKNAACAGFPITMRTLGVPTPSLTVTSEVSIDGAAFTTTTNAVQEVSNGDYYLDLAAADLNGNCIMLRCTASGADDNNIPILTMP